MRRHPSMQKKDPVTQGVIIWRQLGLPGFPDDAPMKLRRPREAAKVRQLRELLR